VNEIVVPALGMWELAEDLPEMIARPERPMNRTPLRGKESKFYSQEIGARKQAWRARRAPAPARLCCRL
jgi:hypothetical protein